MTEQAAHNTGERGFVCLCKCARLRACAVRTSDATECAMCVRACITRMRFGKVGKNLSSGIVRRERQPAKRRQLQTQIGPPGAASVFLANRTAPRAWALEGDASMHTRGGDAEPGRWSGAWREALRCPRAGRARWRDALTPHQTLSGSARLSCLAGTPSSSPSFARSAQPLIFTTALRLYDVLFSGTHRQNAPMTVVVTSPCLLQLQCIHRSTLPITDMSHCHEVILTDVQPCPR